jgi:hypothetical protein
VIRLRDRDKNLTMCADTSFSGLRERSRGNVVQDVLPGLLILGVVVLGACPAQAGDAAAYPWLSAPAAGTVESRIEVPEGFKRQAVPQGSFAQWLRRLPVKPGRPAVHLFDGRLKSNQEAHHMVLEVDVGKRDRQQCADAVMRLRAEYLHQAGKDSEICFRFTDGTPARWTDYQQGLRPQISSRKTLWKKTAGADVSYACFRRYLDIVFSYAGTLSLARELESVVDPRGIEAGDVFIQGGSPGHAVLVVDVAKDARGRRAVLLAQSYMPAQDIHILRNPKSPENPWYVIDGDEPLNTPQWDFPSGSLRRFSATGCPKPR